MPGFYLLISAPGTVESIDDGDAAVEISRDNHDHSGHTPHDESSQATTHSKGAQRQGSNLHDTHDQRNKRKNVGMPRQSVPPNQQGPICLESCTDATIRSHWFMRNVSRAGQQIAPENRAASSGRHQQSSRDGSQRGPGNGGNVGVVEGGGVQIVLAADPTMCLEITGPHEVRDGGIDLRPCNVSAPLQGWLLHEDGGLETTATSDELASVNVGTPTCQCENGRFVDVNAHSAAPGITLQMYVHPLPPFVEYVVTCV